MIFTARYGNRRNGQLFDRPSSRHEMVDKLNVVIDKMEYEIANYRGKNAKKEKIKMQKQLENLSAQKNALFKKNERERNQQIKARNRRDRNDGYNKNRKGRGNNKDRKGRGDNGGNNKQQRREEEPAVLRALSNEQDLTKFSKNCRF